MKEYNFEISRY